LTSGHPVNYTTLTDVTERDGNGAEHIELIDRAELSPLEQLAGDRIAQ